MIFVDGLGLGRDDPAVNPVQPEVCPCLARLLARAQPADACLDMDGLPQSATGQTALLTGINAARLMGRHIEGFPGRRLAEVVAEHNIFKALAGWALESAFANAYLVDDPSEVFAARMKSVTTVAALSALGTVRTKSDLERGHAVSHDVTRETLRSRGYRGPPIAPELAAEHLLGIAATHRFTLFEYFQTDRRGHGADFDAARRVLSVFDAFLARVAREVGARKDMTLVVTSDHGNIEDLSVRTHTRNPVPFAVEGSGRAALSGRVRAITDVTPAIVGYLRGE